RREPEHDVEAGGQFADARAGHRGEVDGDGFALHAVADAVVNAVAGVARVAANVALRGEFALPADLDLEVDVRRAPRVGHRLDRAEVIPAAGPGQEAAEPLEIRVAPLAVGAARVQVGAVVIALPDLARGVADGRAVGTQDAAAQVRDLAHGR